MLGQQGGTNGHPLQSFLRICAKSLIDVTSPLSFSHLALLFLNYLAHVLSLSFIAFREIALYSSDNSSIFLFIDSLRFVFVLLVPSFGFILAYSFFPSSS